MDRDETKAADGEAALAAGMFDLAPVSLWLEDYTGLDRIFRDLRAAGVSSLADYLEEDPERVRACAASLRVLRVNPRTLELFEAKGLDDLTGNLDRVFRAESLATHARELVQLWEGKTRFFSQTVNYTLSGKRLDVEVTGNVLPGHEADMSRVLVVVQDVTEREAARRRLMESERNARGLFEFSPVSLWVEDFSTIRRLLQELRDRGITDFRTFLDVHEEFILRCMHEIRVLDVNDYTLKLFRARDREALLAGTGEIFRDRMRHHFKEQLVELWDGKLHQQREVVNYTLTGEELYLHLQFSTMPGHEEDWTRVLVALTDITARKKAEAYLEFLGKHDELTKLYNRSFYADEINRLDRRGRHPVSVVIIDLNGLKEINDALGHQAGDALLRRMGEVLGKAASGGQFACRIGGDEFAILLPDTDERGAEMMIVQLEELLAINNQFYGTPLTAAMGHATARDGMRLELAIRHADRAMYEAKKAYYLDNAEPRGARL
ncbi:MAG TPA: diguanylate cyclase [Acidisoma sp.]|uniref:diguanylate cyclase domain-containing protein n=1 Tax=Acidisoma sp. TaxID=1872115 RepID=UPI002CD05DC1|nr:diguanylate cyclase [Acidisoma sp.]HTI00651.1 diguanylate cyclase [Acidisoma sp.]